MHTAVQCGVTDTGRPISRRRIVASGPPWVCVGRPEPWMGKFSSSRPFAPEEGHGLERANRKFRVLLTLSHEISREDLSVNK
jgi:hypothetical protein